jgi:hypothetical protein
VDLVQRARGVLEVLEDVARNDEVDGFVSQVGKVLGAADVSDGNEVECGKLRVLPAQVGDTESVDVLNLHTGRNGQRLMERAELDAASGQPTCQVGTLRG